MRWDLRNRMSPCRILAVALVVQIASIGTAGAQDTTIKVIQRRLNPYHNVRVLHLLTRDSSFVVDTSAQHAERDSVLRKIWPAIMQLGAGPFYVYEYHDEQKFIVGEKYGPMVHVFVSPYLGSFTHRRQFDTHGAAGILVAIVYVDAAAGTPLTGPYAQLNLVPGLNCLHLAHDRNVLRDLRGWAAYITPAAPDTTCPHDYGVAGLQPLQVNAERRTGSAQFFDYPTAARFADDSVDRTVIGLKCIAAWCEVGPRGFKTIGPRHERDTSVPHDREHGIKGWHDEQRLAVMVGGVITPSKMRASVIPARDLDQMDEDDYLGKDVQVGTVWFPDDPDRGSDYYQKWGFRKGQNRLFGRKVAADEWTGYVLQAGSNKKYPVGVIRRTHWDVALPGTARWRWSSKDEVIWYDCGGACCEMFIY